MDIDKDAKDTYEDSKYFIDTIKCKIEEKKAYEDKRKYISKITRIFLCFLLGDDCCDVYPKKKVFNEILGQVSDCLSGQEIYTFDTVKIIYEYIINNHNNYYDYHTFMKTLRKHFSYYMIEDIVL